MATINTMLNDINNCVETIRAKLIELDGGVTDTDGLQTCTEVIDGLQSASVTFNLISGDDYEMIVTGGII